jgi:hypothetical protein
MLQILLWGPTIQSLRTFPKLALVHTFRLNSQLTNLQFLLTCTAIQYPFNMG